MKKSFIIIFILCILISSCEFEKTIDIGEIPITPHLVLNGLVFSEKDTNYFYVTKSRPIYSDSIQIWDSSKSLFSILDNAEVISEVNGVKRPVRYSASDTAYILVGKLHETDKIDIYVMHNGEQINSQAVIPSVPQVISLDTATVKRIENGYPQSYIRFKLKIKDHPGNKDYYRLLINNYSYYWIGDNRYSNYNYNQYYTSDPVLTNGYPDSNSGGGLISSVYNYFSVFRDVMFEGQEYVLTFYINKYDTYTGGDPEIKNEFDISVKLQTISEDLYKYYSSLQNSWVSSSNQGSEPFIVYSNINEGFGIMGACNEVTVFEYRNYYSSK